MRQAIIALWLMAAAAWGQSLVFDGSADLLQANSITDDSFSDELTIAAWIKPDTLGDFEGIVGIAYGAPFHWIFRLMASGDLAFRAWAGTAQTITSSSSVLSVGEWQHVAVTVDISGGSVTLYHNGDEAGSAVPVFTSLDAGASQILRVGAYNDGSFDYFFDGSIADPVRIYSYALTANEVAALYQKDAERLNFLGSRDLSSALDLSGNDFTAEGNADMIALDDRWYCDLGTDDRRMNLSTNLYGSMADGDPDHGTVIFRARRLANSLTHYVFCRGGYSGGAKSSYGVYVNGSQSVILMVESTQIFATTGVNRFLDIDGWVEWAITWDGEGSTAKFWKDGVQETGVSSDVYDEDSNLYSFDATDLEPTIGCRNTGGSYDTYADNFEIDFIKIFDSAMSSNDIFTHATSGTMPTNTLVYYTDFTPALSAGMKVRPEEPNAMVADTTQVLDLSGNGNDLAKNAGTDGIALDATGEWVLDTGTATAYTRASGSVTGLNFTNMTASVWFKRDNIAAVNRGLFGRDAGSASHFSLWITGTHKVSFNIPYVLGNVVISDTSVNDTDWHCVVYSRSNNVHELWLDGVLEDITTNAANPTMSGTLNLGYGTGFSFLDGYISQARIYNPPLSTSESAALYGAGRFAPKDAAPVEKLKFFTDFTPPYDQALTEIPMRPSPLLPINAAIPDVWDSSGEGNKWSLTPDRATGPTYHKAITDTNEVTRYGVYAFDNSDDDILENGITTPEDFTISVWLYQSSNPSGYDVFVACAAAVFRIGPSLNLGMGIPYVEGADYSTGAITLNRWYHLVWVVDSNGGPIKYYIDGEYDSQDASFASSLAKSTTARIGTYSIYRYHGYLDELRVYSGLLNTNQVAGLYHGEEPTNNPIIRLDFDDKPYEWTTYDGQHTITAYPEGTAGPTIGDGQ